MFKCRICTDPTLLYWYFHLSKECGKLLLSLLVRIQVVLQLDRITLTGVVGVGNADTQCPTMNHTATGQFLLWRCVSVESSVSVSLSMKASVSVSGKWCSSGSLQLQEKNHKTWDLHSCFTLMQQREGYRLWPQWMYILVHYFTLYLSLQNLHQAAAVLSSSVGAWSTAVQLWSTCILLLRLFCFSFHSF